MEAVGTKMAEWAAHYWTTFWTYADPRSQHLPLVQSPLLVFAIIGSYLYFVLSLGPRLMRNRPAYNPKRLMLVYNALQVVWCAYIMWKAYEVGWGWRFSWTCEPLLDSQMEPEDFAMAEAVWLYFILKVVDLLDTVFMVVKKNDRQITFLHVYHHAGMVFASWFGTKMHPGGGITLMGPINCFVHVILYGYYFVSLLEPRAKASWWKKYITTVQLVQFAINLVHQLIPFLTPSCPVERKYVVISLVQNAYMFYLFSDFYYKNYIKTKPKSTRKRD
ncbi:Elongation of very long chain fatty acids protein 1 [Frankliniella fusca]|uniref:Elongation of very long chain fatty acids protein n=1 Tax=Frankliniella fusca TaxID=407009 RepID=A0AAE1LKL8_9NEOP|nr:Elongation of very long chain fatty acids protein 1 [Frankliniella fusca]